MAGVGHVVFTRVSISERKNQPIAKLALAVFMELSDKVNLLAKRLEPRARETRNTADPPLEPVAFWRLFPFLTSDFLLELCHRG